MAVINPLKIEGGRIKNSASTDSLQFEAIGLGTAPNASGLKLEDDYIAYFGAGDDLQIRHVSAAAESGLLVTDGDLVLENDDVNDKIILRLGDAAGSTALELQDSAESPVFSVDSNGVTTITSDLHLDGEFAPNDDPGTSGQVLQSQGTGTYPVWVDGASATGTASETWHLNSDAAAADDSNAHIELCAGRGAGGSTVQAWRVTFDHNANGSAGSYVGDFILEYASDNGGSFTTYMELNASTAAIGIGAGASTSTDGIAIGPGSNCAQTGSICIGDGAAASGSGGSNVAIGRNVDLHGGFGGNGSVIIGGFSSAGSTNVYGGNVIAVGCRTTVGNASYSANNVVTIGTQNSVQSGSEDISNIITVGSLATSAYGQTMVISHGDGTGGKTSAENQALIGSEDFQLHDWWLGGGKNGTAQETMQWMATAGDPTVDGWNWSFHSGGGGAASGANAGSAGSLTISGGIGGAGISSFDAGDGGNLVLIGGNGGTQASGAGGVGGSLTFNAGVGTGSEVDGDIAIGLTTAANINIGHASANVGFYGTAATGQASDIGVLTDSTGGSSDNTVSAVSGSGDDSTINDNFADLIDQINQLRTVLRNIGIMA